ncbi:glutamine-rich protein 2 isoform X5 [Sparus aurata]|nr:glutamine-rich protein 2-like isoform X5 [Sparus aurata]
MKLIQELNEQKDDLKEEMKELHQQHKTVGAETLTAVETCCHRVDDLEETVRSLKETFQKYPEPEELIQCVTWDDMQAALLGDTESTHKECVHSGLIAVRPTHTPFSSTFTVNTAASRTSSPSSSHPVQDTDRSATPPSPAISRQISTLQQATDTQPGGEASPQLTRPQTGRLSAGVFQSLKAGGSERYPEMMSALRNIGKQRDTFNKLEARVAALEEAKVEQSELTHIRELITHKGSQEVSSNLMDQLNQQRALIKNLMSERDKNVELVDDVQKAILQLQAECEKLHESSRSLQEDSRQRHTHIEELYKKTEELEEKKADKRVVEREIKADKSALESKVSRLQFDSVTEQLNAMFHELLHKVTGQEQDWHKVIDRLSTEMECKLNRIELDSVKKQLEGRWRNIHEKLQAQEAPEHEDAAALRKQLVGRFHCLSCDRPVVKYTSGTHLVKLPSSSGFPAHKSNRPFTVYALERFRQHYRSERISERTDYSQLTVSRSCGGRHTVTSASQRRTGLHKHHTQTEVDTMIQSEEVDIIGMDGHIYKGRLNTPAVRNTDSKLPTISAKEGLSKDKKSSMSHKPSASPEVGHTAQLHHTHSAKSAQCSRSASSSSGRDWPVSALGCTSQSSITPASATAESNAGRQANEPLDL